MTVRARARDVLALAKDLAFAKHRALARASDLDLGTINDHARALASGLYLAHDMTRDPSLARALASSRSIALDLAQARDDGHDHARLLGDASALAVALAGDLARFRDFAHGRNLSMLERICADARTLSEVVAHLALASAEPEEVVAPKGRPVLVAGKLANAAVRVLPAGHRSRYHAEYQSELHELAATGTARWRQVVYALRLLDRAWVLRAELRTPSVERARS
jgi:hypothetical protein